MAYKPKEKASRGTVLWKKGNNEEENKWHGGWPSCSIPPEYNQERNVTRGHLQKKLQRGPHKTECEV